LQIGRQEIGKWTQWFTDAGAEIASADSASADALPTPDDV
jgi:hypothetical protein